MSSNKTIVKEIAVVAMLNLVVVVVGCKIVDWAIQRRARRELKKNPESAVEDVSHAVIKCMSTTNRSFFSTVSLMRNLILAQHFAYEWPRLESEKRSLPPLTYIPLMKQRSLVGLDLRQLAESPMAHVRMSDNEYSHFWIHLTRPFRELVDFPWAVVVNLPRLKKKDSFLPRLQSTTYPEVSVQICQFSGTGSSHQAWHPSLYPIVHAGWTEMPSSYVSSLDSTTKISDAVRTAIKSGKRFIMAELSFKDIYEHASRLLGDAQAQPSHLSHANALIIDLAAKTIERVEPHGNNCNFIVMGAWVDLILREEFKRALPDFTYRSAAMITPFVGPQTHSAQPWTTGGYCSAWSFMFMHLKMLNPDLSMTEICARLVHETTPHQALVMIRKYLSLMYRMVNRETTLAYNCSRGNSIYIGFNAASRPLDYSQLDRSMSIGFRRTDVCLENASSLVMF